MTIQLNLKNTILFCYILLAYFLGIVAQENDDVELRIDFNTGSVIANESPKVVKPINNITVAAGTTDTIIADLNDIFNDAESGSALNFSVISLDTSLVNVKINEFDSILEASFVPEKLGRTDIIITANDGSKNVHDTVSVVVKKAFYLKEHIPDTTIKSGYSILMVRKDISRIFPVLDSASNSKYTFNVSSNNEALVSVSANTQRNSITLEIADSSFGKADIEIIVEDEDQLAVKDTFTVKVKKSFRKKEYRRESVKLNPGISIFTGVNYSGAAVRLWFNDIIGIGLNGYYKWKQDGIGTAMELMVKPSLNFLLQPYGSLSGGYHRQTISKTYKEANNLKIEKDLPLFVFRAVGGLDAWLGESKQHVIGAEVGYTFGESKYTPLSITTIGSSIPDTKKETYKMPPLHLRIGYSFYLKKL